MLWMHNTLLLMLLLLLMISACRCGFDTASSIKWQKIKFLKNDLFISSFRSLSALFHYAAVL
jgi:hypothetical protein